MQKKETRGRKPGNNYEKILTAAKSCLLQKGFSGTTMDAIAAQAGISRQTIYRTFKNRDELFATLLDRELMQAINEEISALSADTGFEKALIRGTELTFSLVRNTPLVTKAFITEDTSWYHAQFLDTESTLHKKIIASSLRIWQNKFDTARKAGELDPALSDQEVIEWIANIHYLIFARASQTFELEEYIRRYMLPPLQRHKQAVSN